MFICRCLGFLERSKVCLPSLTIGLNVMRVLVTGSKGSLMQWVIARLLNAGYEVRGVDNYSKPSMRKDVNENQYEFIEGDLCDISIVSKAMKNVDIVIQSAAHVYGVRGIKEKGADTIIEDVQLHSNVVQESVKKNVCKFIYLSSSMVYERSNVTPHKESHAFDLPLPKTDYGVTKVVCERILLSISSKYGMPTTIWRPFNIINPYEISGDKYGESHVFADFINKIAVEKLNPMPIIGSGKQVRCFTWIDDIAQVISENANNAHTNNQIMNIGRLEPVTMIELANIIHKMCIDKGIVENKPFSVYSNDFYINDVVMRIPDVSLVKNITGWEANTSLSESLSKCLEIIC